MEPQTWRKLNVAKLRICSCEVTNYPVDSWRRQQIHGALPHLGVLCIHVTDSATKFRVLNSIGMQNVVSIYNQFTSLFHMLRIILIVLMYTPGLYMLTWYHL